jgi:hypothetical protein
VSEARGLVGPDLHFAFLERHVTAADAFDIAGALHAQGVPVAFLSRPDDAARTGERPFICKPFKPAQVRQALRGG